MADFVQTAAKGSAKIQGVNLDHVTHYEWEIAANGCDGVIRLYLTNGVLLSVPLADPMAESVAKLLGLEKTWGAWPKLKQEAEARQKIVKEEKAAADRRRGLQRV
jgi:hypothetical protein